MSKRFHNAWHIWGGGACNLRSVARILVEAVDEATDDTGDAACDPAVQMIADHLCFLVGLPQPSLELSQKKWDEIYNFVKEKVECS